MDTKQYFHLNDMFCNNGQHPFKMAPLLEEKYAERKMAPLFEEKYAERKIIWHW